MRGISKALLIASSVFVSCFSHDAMAERRVAFVVGNGAYKFAQSLPNPAVDAKSMSAMLRNIGFEVVEGTDLGRDAMTARLREFAVKTQGADLALFFYAGHGIAVNGKNYLIPVDADLKSELDVKIGSAIEIDSALDQTMADAKVKLVLLDACRDNPFVGKIRSARTRSTVVPNGLAEMKSGEGTLIAFATAPGQTALDGKAGENSPFTRALLTNMPEQGLEVGLALTKVRAQVQEETGKQQVPWTNTNLTGFVYMNPSAGTASTGTAALATSTETTATATRTTAGSELELEFWRSVRDSNKPEELSAYLTRFPSGNFASIARSRLAALQTEATGKGNESVFTTPGSRETEDKLGLDRKDRREIQKRLTALGFYEGSADGNFRETTREALDRWQGARNYPKSGYLNKLQQEAMLGEQLPAVRSVERAAPVERPSRQRREPTEQRVGGFHLSPGSAAMIGGALGGMIGRRF